jgi:arginase family enzyme
MPEDYVDDQGIVEPGETSGTGFGGRTLDRRQFLKGAAVVGAAVAFGGIAEVGTAAANTTGKKATRAPNASRRRAAPPTKLKRLRVVELLTSAGTGYIGRTRVANGEYPESDRGKIRPGTDNLTVNSISRPRELDDYHLTGLYGLAGVPSKISEVLLTNADADSRYPGIPRYQALAKEISDRVYTGLTAGQGHGVFVVGGSCAPAVGTAGGLRRAYGDKAKIGILYLDAHGDVNTKASTFSGSMGGMDLAAILGLDQEEWWQAACGGAMRPLDASIQACGRNLDSGVDPVTGPFGEVLNLQQAGSDYVLVEGFNDEANWRAHVKAIADKVDVLYLHIDADVVDNAFIPNVNTPEMNGPDIWNLMRNIKIVMDTDKVALVKLASIFFGRSYATNKARLETMQGFKFPDVAGETAEQATNRASQIAILSGIRMISTVFGNWEYMPRVVDCHKH